jgi:hypothetical protein
LEREREVPYARTVSFADGEAGDDLSCKKVLFSAGHHSTLHVDRPCVPVTTRAPASATSGKSAVRSGRVKTIRARLHNLQKHAAKLGYTARAGTGIRASSRPEYELKTSNENLTERNLKVLTMLACHV